MSVPFDPNPPKEKIELPQLEFEVSDIMLSPTSADIFRAALKSEPEVAVILLENQTTYEQWQGTIFNIKHHAPEGFNMPIEVVLDYLKVFTTISLILYAMYSTLYI